MKSLLKIQYNWRTRERGIKSLNKEFNLSKLEIISLNNKLKEEWVKSGKAKIVGYWLLTCSFGVLSMIVLGGYVRLTKSGLSMIRWDLGKISPPNNKNDWEKEFNEYKKHPQFKNDFPNMNLHEFKKIYLLEFYHRQIGKLLGIIFSIPLFYFSFKGYIKRKLYYNLLTLLGIGSLQGFLGWWMVKSGLKENLGKNYNQKDVKVSPYRLMIHFSTAVFLYGILLNTSMFLLKIHPGLTRNIIEYKALRITRHALFLGLFWNIFTLISGSLMAGSYAGKICNTFPKMGDIWFPTRNHLMDKSKIQFYKDIFENQFIIHFNHRTLASIYLFSLIWNFNKLLGLGIISKTPARSYFYLILISIFQYCLGIMNVITGCKLEWAQIHQFIGISAFTICILGISSTKKLNKTQMKILLKELYNKDKIKLDKILYEFEKESPKYYNFFFHQTVEEIKKNIKI